MNNHLSSDQIFELIIGDDAAAEEHCRECDACAAEVHTLRDSVSLFRGSLVHFSEQQRPREILLRREQPIHLWRWAVVTAGLALAVAIPAYQNAVERQRQAEAAQDEVLLQQVNEHLSRAVPASMEPFIELMSEVPDSTEDNTGGLQ